MAGSSFLHSWFSWPAGAVLTNLIASALWLSVGAWKFVGWARRFEASHDDLHDKLDRLHLHLGVPEKELP